jgi:hypothetical protein
MPTHARAIAAAVVIIITIVSFRLIGASRNVFLVSISAVSALVDDRPRDCQKPGSEPEARGFGSTPVDIEGDPAIFKDEPDHATVADEVLAFANSQYVMYQCFHTSRTLCPISQENHLAGPRRRRVIDFPNRHFVTVDSLSGDDLLKRVPERVIAQNANVKRRIGTSKRAVRPLDKLSEAQQEGSFYSVLQRAIGRV